MLILSMTIIWQFNACIQSICSVYSLHLTPFSTSFTISSHPLPSYFPLSSSVLPPSLACLSVTILFNQIIHLPLINAWLPHWCWDSSCETVSSIDNGEAVLMISEQYGYLKKTWKKMTSSVDLPWWMEGNLKRPHFKGYSKVVATGRGVVLSRDKPSDRLPNPKWSRPKCLYLWATLN